MPDGPGDADLPARLAPLLDHLRDRHEALALHRTAEAVRALWKFANVHLVERAPWKLLTMDSAAAAGAIRTDIGLIGVCARAAWPIVPDTAAKALAAIGEDADVPAFPSTEHLAIPAGRRIVHPGPLFAKLGTEWAEAQSRRFAETV